MANIRLGGHEGHRHLVADLAAAQLGFQDEGILVGGAEAGCALNRAGYDRPGLLAKLFEGRACVLGMVDVANRLRVAAMRSKPLDLVEGQLRTGGNDQEVVWHAGAVRQLKRILFRMHASCRDGLEVDAALGEGALKVDLDVRALAPVYRHPWV